MGGSAKGDMGRAGLVLAPRGRGQEQIQPGHVQRGGTWGL